MQSLYLLYLDRHHLGDALFLKSLAQHLGAEDRGSKPCLIVHGSGEKVERTLEAQGIFPERTEGVLDIEGEEQRRLVERAVREMNQEVVGALTDEVVSTVGIQGVDRGLLREGSDGTILAENVGWLSALLKQHVVPVVSALVEEPESGRVREIPPAEVVIALAKAMKSSFEPIACTLTTTDQPGLSDGGTVLDEAPLEAVSETDVPEPSTIRRISEASVPILITTLQGLFGAEMPRGTRIQE